MGAVTIDVGELVARLQELRPDIYIATVVALERLVLAHEEAANAKRELARFFSVKEIASS